MNARITKNELIAMNNALGADNAALRAMVSEMRVRIEAIKGQRKPATGGGAPKGVASGAKRRPLASFFFLRDAGSYITELKQRGCKVTLTAQRDALNHFVVFAG